MTITRDRPPFIGTQGIRLLAETDQPQRFLRAEYFRAGRGPQMAAAVERDLGTWLPVERHELARNEVRNADGTWCDLSRLVITTDAGVGKTATIERLHAEVNCKGSDRIAFVLDFAQLAATRDLIRDRLVPALQRAWVPEAESPKPEDPPSTGASRTQPPPTSADRLAAVVEHLRAAGRIVLLIDALDQAPPDGSGADALLDLLRDPAWHACRVIISGRPHALQRHWTRLFDGSLGFGWRFVQLDEFDESQQRQLLGCDAQGRQRYDLIQAEARDILATPRVLKYLRELPSEDLGLIRTAGDVYWHSIQYLLKEGMKNSRDARCLGLAADEPVPDTLQARSLARTRQLLGAIGFEMAATLVSRPGGDGDPAQRVPNFDGVRPGRFHRFKQCLLARLGETDQQPLQRDIDSLAALNDVISHGVFDTDVAGLDRILWRNRTLQEFFAAYWLAQHCRPQDATGLWDWIYQPERPQTEEYYWVWRFVCEMHADGRDPEAWTRAVEPLFRPGDGTPQGTKRWSEMIYRAWEPLQETIREGELSARQMRDRFLGEFQQILDGDRGGEAQMRAREFRDSFLDVPAGQFRMGSPPEKQGMPPDVRKQWQEYLDREGEPEERARERTSKYSYPPGKQGEQWRQNDLRWWTNVFRERDIEAIARWLYKTDETSEDLIQQVEAFRLSRWPTINAWYRLFAPGHGGKHSYWAEKYAQISPDQGTPVIFVSWYDAWAFCLWAHWDGQSCRLPREYEWEYAAKADTGWDRWDQKYWWGDEFDATKCNGDQRVGRTTHPSAEHANAWGFVDILGNVWEWCEDEYRRVYSRTGTPDSSARVLRGGCWNYFAVRLRSAYRNDSLPALTENYSGVRAARALRKS